MRSVLLRMPSERVRLHPRAAGEAELFFRAGVRALDGLVLCATGLAAKLLLTSETTPTSVILAAALAGALLTILRLDRHSGYTLRNLRKLPWQLRQATTGWAVALAALVALAYFTSNLRALSREWLSLWFGCGLVGLFAVRAGVWVFLRKVAPFTLKVAAIGHGPPLEQYTSLADAQFEDVEVVAVVHPDDPKALANLEGQVREGNVDEVVIALPWDERERLAMLLGRLRAFAVNVRFFPFLLELGLPMRGFEHVAGVPLLRVFERPLSGWNLVAKALFDRIVALILVTLLLPVFLAVALAIKLTSPGPVFFRQRRWGFNGDEIQVLKFRSMHDRPADDSAVPQATRDDPRVFPVGKILRKTSLDELPQLLNVLGGSMSLVGPRPHAVAHNEAYARVVDDYLSRHRVKPGITGWAQINGARGETDTLDKMQLRVRYDLQYIDTWSLSFDVWILLRTPFALLAGDAY